MTLCTERIRTLDDIRAFLDGNVAADITPHDRKAAYAFVERALVESKNGNVVRRWLGHSHIPERLAPQANAGSTHKSWS